MMKLLPLIQEARSGKIIAYHGRTVDSNAFDLQYVGKGHDQDGPGFYFSSDKKDAAGYGRLLKVELRLKKVIPTEQQDLANYQIEIQTLVKRAPNLSDTLTNWDENPRRAMMQLMDSILDNDTPFDAFLSVWAECYRYEPEKYLEGLVELKYDGVIKEVSDNIIHYIVFNPVCIKVLGEGRVKI